jgi:hypothetical protein
VRREPLRAGSVTRKRILFHQERERITNHHGNRLAMLGRIALDLVGEGDVDTRHEGHVLFGFGAATGAACRFGHERASLL